MPDFGFSIVARLAVRPELPGVRGEFAPEALQMIHHINIIRPKPGVDPADADLHVRQRRGVDRQAPRPEFFAPLAFGTGPADRRDVVRLPGPERFDVLLLTSASPS